MGIYETDNILIGEPAACKYIPECNAFFPLLSKNGKIKYHLRRSVCYGKEQCLESQNTLVLNMRMYPTYVSDAPSRLRTVCIIDSQASVLRLMPGTYLCSNEYTLLHLLFAPKRFIIISVF